jgi:hypothetical protein
LNVKLILTERKRRGEDDAGDEERDGRVKVERPSTLAAAQVRQVEFVWRRRGARLDRQEKAHSQPDDQTRGDDTDVAETADLSLRPHPVSKCREQSHSRITHDVEEHSAHVHRSVRVSTMTATTGTVTMLRVIVIMGTSLLRLAGIACVLMLVRASVDVLALTVRRCLSDRSGGARGGGCAGLFLTRNRGDGACTALSTSSRTRDRTVLGPARNAGGSTVRCRRRHRPTERSLVDGGLSVSEFVRRLDDLGAGLRGVLVKRGHGVGAGTAGTDLLSVLIVFWECDGAVRMSVVVGVAMICTP